MNSRHTPEQPFAKDLIKRRNLLQTLVTLPLLSSAFVISIRAHEGRKSERTADYAAREALRSDMARCGELGTAPRGAAGPSRQT